MPSSPPKAGIPKVRIARTARADLLFRLNRALLYFAMCAYVPIILLLITGMAYLGYSLTHWAVGLWWLGAIGFYAAALAILLDGFFVLLFLAMLAGLLPLFHRHEALRISGISLEPRRHPKFTAVVDRLAKRLGTRAPDVRVLDFGENAGVADADACLDDQPLIPKARLLYVGAGMVVHTRIDELATILCHEMVHAATGDTRMSKIALRLHASLVTQLLQLSWNPGQEPRLTQRLLYCIFRLYERLFGLLYFADCRYRELRADRVTAEICGPQNLRNALITTYMIAEVPGLNIATLCLRYSDDEMEVGNLYEEHRRRWAELTPAQRARAGERMFMQTTSWWASHPCLAQRIRNVAHVEAKELVAPAPATTLFKHWEELEEKLTRKIMRFGREYHAQFVRDLNASLARRL
jgi:Zn-dependent protease with chaperone function